MDSSFAKLILAFALVGAAAPAPALADAGDDQYVVASGHYARGRWNLAVEEFQTFRSEYPQHARLNLALFFQAEAHVQLGQFTEARQLFRDFVRRDPQSRFYRQAMFRSGETSYMLAENVEARTTLEAFRREFPDDKLNAFVLPYLGEIALLDKDLPRAKEHFDLGLKMFPDGELQDDCRFGQARVLEEQNQSDDAARIYLALAAKTGNPLADDAQFRLGAVQYAAGDYQEAIATLAEFDTTFQQSELFDKARLSRGWALFKLDKFDEARELFQGLEKSETVSLEACYWLGLTHKAQQQWPEAAQVLLAASTAEPQNALTADIRFHAGDALRRDGQSAKAAEQFDQVLLRWPQSEWADDSLFGKLQLAVAADDHQAVDKLAAQFASQYSTSALTPDVVRLRAQSLVARNDFAQAAQILAPQVTSAAKDAPTPAADRYLLALLAVCYGRTGELSPARQHYQEFVALKPEKDLWAATTQHLAEGVYAAGDYAWSAELFGTLAQPDQLPAVAAKGLSGLAWSQFKADKLAEAAATFQQLHEAYPQDPLAPEAAVTRGQILEKQQQPDAALAMYRLVIDTFPGDKQVPLALLQAARVHDQQQQDGEAAAHYERLTTDYPEEPFVDTALYEWAWVMRDLSKPEQADELFQQLRTEHPQSRFWADATYRLAERAYAQRKFAEVDKLLAELLAAQPEQAGLPHVMFLQGQAATGLLKWPEVIGAMQRLVDSAPDDALRPLADYWVAEAEYRLGNYDTAGQRLSELAERIAGRNEPWMAMVPLRQSQVLAQQKKWQESQLLAATIAERFPGFDQQFEVDYVIGRALASRGEFEAARAAYQKVIRSPQGGKTETAAMAQWMIGESYFHQKNFETALREYLRLEILYAYPTWQAAALLQAGKCHEMLGEGKPAADVYQRLVEEFPECSFIDEATRRLKTVQEQTARKR